MVAGLFATAVVLVDADRAQAVGGGGAEQKVIDAETVVALPGARLIVPICPHSAAGA